MVIFCMCVFCFLLYILLREKAAKLLLKEPILILIISPIVRSDSRAELSSAGVYKTLRSQPKM